MSLSLSPRHRRAPLSPLERVGRAVLIGLAWLLIVVGAVGSVLPGHLGLPVLILGLIILLRSSRGARKRFIDLQRRHPRFVFPLRRLLRRRPEILPVAWQQALRLERLLVPRRWRRARSLRRRLFRRRPRPS